MMKNTSRLFLTCIFASCLLSCAKTVEESPDTVISSLDDLVGAPVAVLSGSVQDLLLCELQPECKMLRCDVDTDNYTMVSTGKANAAFESSISWSMAKSSFPDIVQVGEEVKPQPIAFAFAKGNDELVAKFNSFLKEFFSENNEEDLIAGWSDSENGRKMPDPDDVAGANGTLHFGVSAITPPFEFIREGQVCGIEPEIMARFAASLDMKWDFANIAFSGLIAYIQTGKGDIGCSIICDTPERRESVDFSEPWCYESSVLLVNRKYAPAELRGDTDEEELTFFQKLGESINKTLIKEDRYKMLLQGLGVTMIISMLAALFGTLLGILLCFTSTRRNKFVSGLSNLYIEFMRCMPQVVFLMIMFYVVFGKSDISGEWVGVIAFTLCFGAYTSVIFRSSVQSIDKGQTEAALSMGFSRLRAFTNVVLPQTVQRALPVYKGEFIGLVKATSIVGYIAVFDLTKAGDIIRSRTYEAFFPLIIVTILYFLVIWLLTIVLRYLEAKTQPKRKKFFK